MKRLTALLLAMIVTFGLTVLLAPDLECEVYGFCHL